MAHTFDAVERVGLVSEPQRKGDGKARRRFTALSPIDRARPIQSRSHLSGVRVGWI